MAYSELIKRFDRIRDYMRNFYVFGFWHREQYTMKSSRSYDNERRRAESWLHDYVSFRQAPSGKTMFISVDGRTVANNPFYKVFKTKSFTNNDIMLHFYLMDLLADGEILTINEILDRIKDDYLSFFEEAYDIDESTLRKKLKEYESLGLVEKIQYKHIVRYTLPKSEPELESWSNALAFFSESSPLGIVGSFLLDKLTQAPSFFRFKHHFLLYALDSEIMHQILLAIDENYDMHLTLRNRQTGPAPQITVHPLKIYISTQNGRQYLLAWDLEQHTPKFIRLENIILAKPIKKLEQTAVHSEEFYKEQYRQISEKLWGVSLGDAQHTEHLEMTIFADDDEYFIVQRLEREKRNGQVHLLEKNLYHFSIDVYDARELLPWIRTFIGRIVELNCSNPDVAETFYKDLTYIHEKYGGNDDVIS